MSHFTVAVFTGEFQNAEDMLEPFSESIEVEQYVSQTKAELIEHERRYMQQVFENQYKDWMNNTAAYEAKSTAAHIAYLKELPERMKRTDEEIYKDVINTYEESDIDEDGNVLSTYNPDSKWDWYEIGGRWQGMLILKPGKHGERGNPGIGEKISEGYDSALVADVDFDEMRRQLIRKLTPYEEIIKSGFYNEEYKRERFSTETEYIQNSSNFSTYAVLTPDGEWHAPGEMGSFGVSSEKARERRDWEDEYYEQFIAPAIKNNWRITIVDCHI